MIEDLQARFLPSFVASARMRIERVLDIADRRDQAALGTALRELHALAGEAGLLGLPTIIPLARAGEQSVHSLRSSGTEEAALALISVLHELARTIELVSSSPPPGGKKP